MFCAREPPSGLYDSRMTSLPPGRPGLDARALASAALLLVSCGSRAPAVDGSARPPTAHAPFGPAEEDDPRPEPATEDRPEVVAERAEARKTPGLERLLCGGQRCCVESLVKVGRDRAGQDLLVVSLDYELGSCLVPPPPSPPGPFGAGRLDKAPRPRPRRQPAAEPEPEAAPASEGNAEEGEGEPCHRHEDHLVARKNGRVRSLAFLASTCGKEPDYPEAGETTGADAEKKLFSHTVVSDRHRHESTVTLGLDPLRLAEVETMETSDYVSEFPFDKETWDWDKFSGTASWGAVDCHPPPPPDGGVDSGGDDDRNEVPSYAVASVLIPLLELPADFVASGWRTTALGTCAASIDGDASGYTIHRSGDKGGDARLKAVVSGDHLFVEVSDDRFVGPGKSWIKDDHLELWRGDFTSGRGRQCGSNEERMVQWGIRVADGAVFPAHGTPEPLTGVERVIAGRTARFKIPLPGPYERMTIVYSDSDDGRRQDRLIATSELKFGDPATLGTTHAVKAEDATCIVKKGALQPKRAPLLIEAGKPITEGLF